MADEPKKIIVDDDWKAQARREKEILTEKTESRQQQAAAFQPTMFLELVNLLVMQVMVGLGLVQGPAGERIPPNLAAAKHFIDLLAALEEKTRNNLSADEKRVMDQVLYEMRMAFVQITSGPMGGMPGGEDELGAPRTGPAGTGGPLIAS